MKFEGVNPYEIGLFLGRVIELEFNTVLPSVFNTLLSHQRFQLTLAGNIRKFNEKLP